MTDLTDQIGCHSEGACVEEHLGECCYGLPQQVQQGTWK